MRWCDPPLEEGGTPLSLEDKKKARSTLYKIKDKVNRLTLSSDLASRHMGQKVKELQETLARKATKTLWKKFYTSYEKYLGSWIRAFVRRTSKTSHFLFRRAGVGGGRAAWRSWQHRTLGIQSISPTHLTKAAETAFPTLHR